MSEVKAVSSPMSTGCAKEPPDSVFDNKQMYQSLVGSFLYLACWSHPDIYYAVHWLCKQSAKFHNKYWQAAKRVLRYLKETAEFKLVLDTTAGESMVAFSDASWCNESNAKSTSQFLIFVCGALVGWKSQKQTLVATSSCEAEYAALNECVLQIEWMVKLKCALS